MLVGTQPRKKRNSTRINLIISTLFHGLIVGVLLYFAAREGLLGKQLKKITVEMVKTEKPKEPPKPKEPEKPKTEPPKVETPKVVETAKVEAPKTTVPPPTSEAPPTVAPPVSSAATFEFDGGKIVESTTDAVQIYKGLVENALRFNWDRPKDTDDHTNVAEVEVAVAQNGDITSPVWKKSSGQKQWDNSVREAIASTKKVSRPPPTNFPSRVLVRFDVEALVPVSQP